MVDAGVETARPTSMRSLTRLSIEIPQEPVYINADPLRIAQVLSNLLTNAAKYTDAGGNIRLLARRSSDSMVIQVIDYGIGIASEALPRIFHMFSQVTASQDRSDGGIGIGLAPARGLVELHGATSRQRASASAGEANSPCVCPSEW